MRNESICIHLTLYFVLLGKKALNCIFINATMQNRQDWFYSSCTKHNSPRKLWIFPCTFFFWVFSFFLFQFSFIWIEHWTPKSVESGVFIHTHTHLLVNQGLIVFAVHMVMVKLDSLCLTLLEQGDWPRPFLSVYIFYSLCSTAQKHEQNLYLASGAFKTNHTHADRYKYSFYLNPLESICKLIAVTTVSWFRLLVCFLHVAN